MIALGLAGCGRSDASGTFVGGDDSAAIVLRLNQTDEGVVSGNIGIALPDFQRGEMKVTARAISGTGDGTEFTLISHARDWTESDTSFSLSRHGSDIVMRAAGGTQDIPLIRSDVADYDRRVAELEASLSANDVRLVPED